MPKNEAPQQVVLTLMQEDVDVIRIALSHTARKTHMPALKTACEHVSRVITESIKTGGAHEG